LRDYLWPMQPRRPRHSDPARVRDLAVAALRAGVCLRFTYSGRARLAEVHAVGLSTAGREDMSTWQIAGDSESGRIPGWRTFCLDECFDVELSDVPSLAPRPDFKPGDGFARIDAQV